MTYDYIFTGAGCAGLSLLMRLLDHKEFAGKKILLLDKSEKSQNDRTWCFWEKKPGYFEQLVCKSWDKIWVHGEDYSEKHHSDPYRYKMIRGINFYDYCFSKLADNPAVTFLNDGVEEIGNRNGKAYVKLSSGAIVHAGYIFNSIIFQQPVVSKNVYYLLQHFKGFVVDAPAGSFNPEEAVLMDFRVPQHGATGFVYALPLTDCRALVEYTLFSKQVLVEEGYDEVLRAYLKDWLKIDAYTIVSTEFGVIPMTNYRFPVNEGNIINIGTAGGQTKGSTGYTFSFIQKHSEAIVQRMLAGRSPVVGRSFLSKRFNWYDGILLNILAGKKLPGAFIFTQLFRKNKIQDIFQFLDNESSLLQEIRIVSTLPTRVFAGAARATG
jgi:lycopene beta-cyclase